MSRSVLKIEIFKHQRPKKKKRKIITNLRMIKFDWRTNENFTPEENILLICVKYSFF